LIGLLLACDNVTANTGRNMQQELSIVSVLHNTLCVVLVFIVELLAHVYGE